ncbi:MAG: protein kinase, partial [Desulfobacterales bacterium]|nr:protein kinase [Desulfobacterales bacterium]
MGVVYKALDVRLGRAVALKVLPLGKLMDPDRKRRFVQEARAASALNHPHIVTVHDIDQSGGVDFIAMEYVEGKTLGELIGRKGLKLGEALKYAIQIADALVRTHSVSVVHRDLKPGNVMVTSDGRVKILDFGLAKLTEPASVGPKDASLAAPPSTELGLIFGTLGYMSPEQAQGKKVDARSDIFSFGTVLYEMLTGRRLFTRDTQAQTLAAILDAEPPPLPAEIPRELERVVARCLRKDVDHRYQHMDDVKIALEELKEDSDSGKLSAPAGLQPSPRRKVLMWAVGAVAAVLLVAGGWYLGRSRTETASRPSMRFTINLPAEAPLAPAGSMPLGQDRLALSLSPDGNRLAYVAQVGNTTQIYTRDMLSGKIEPLPDTQGGHSPFFSPDGSSIGFFADGKLKRTPSIGGPVLSLADAPQPVGGVWGSDGTIYFNRMNNDGIQKLRADGDAVEVVIRGVVTTPEFLSVTRGLLATSPDGTVHVGQNGEPRRLIGGSGARYAPSGHLVYAAEGKLAAVPLNESKVEITGTPVTLFDDLRTGSHGVAQFTFARNGTLIYAPGHPHNLTSFVWVDRTGRARPAGLPAGHYLPFDLSPDG